MNEVSSVWLRMANDKWLVGGMAELCHVCEGPYVNQSQSMVVRSGVNCRRRRK